MRISDCSADVCSSDLEAWSPAPEYLLFAVISDSPDDFIWLEITLALVIAADIGVARRRGGRQAQRFGRGGEAAALIGRIVLVDLHLLPARADRFLELLRLDRLLGDLPPPTPPIFTY